MLSTLDIPNRKGKVGTLKSFPRKWIIWVPYLYDIQENHSRLGLPRDTSIIRLNRKDRCEDFDKEISNGNHKCADILASKEYKGEYYYNAVAL